MTPRSLVNPKSISAAIEYFFGRGELSQVVDQTNPLSMLTHERRLSALGPGGLNRKRAGFRGPRRAHFPLRPHLPHRDPGRHEHRPDLQPGDLRRRGRVRLPGHALSEGQERQARPTRSSGCAPTRSTRRSWPRPTPRSQNGKLVGRHDRRPLPRRLPDGAGRRRCSTSTWRPAQMVGVSAGLIPFLEHDDANRALMGSNMQRQAVPLLITEPPLVATGLEVEAAQNSSMLVRAARQGRGRPTSTPDRIEIGGDVYPLRKFVGLNERTCQNQKPIVGHGRQGGEGPGHRRRRRHLPGRVGPGPQRAGGLHGLGRLQLRGRHHHQRRAGGERHLHLDPHRGVRHRNPRDQAGPRGIHPRHPQRQREDAPQPGRERHRAGGHLRPSRATSWWARSRPSRRPS